MMIPLSELFEVRYGVNLELNKLELQPDGVNFVSRSAQNNGVTAKVKRLANVEPIGAGVLTVAGGGSVLETFLQTEPFYSGRDLYYLRPHVEMTQEQMLYYCMCIRANKYRYNYGRQANRTLKNIMVPTPDEIPDYVSQIDIGRYDGCDAPASSKPPTEINVSKWGVFTIASLFDLRKGQRLTKANMLPGDTLFIGASDTNNGETARIGQDAIHSGGTISVSYNGSVAEAFYQTEDYWATDDVNVLYPKGFKLTPALALFICTIIRMEKYRFNYGRKWHLERMRESIIKLPVTEAGEPDLLVMENYIKSLPYSSQLK